MRKQIDLLRKIADWLAIAAAALNGVLAKVEELGWQAEEVQPVEEWPTNPASEVHEPVNSAEDDRERNS